MSRVTASISISILLAAQAFAQPREVYFQGDLTPLNVTPQFDRGYLAVYDWNHRVDLFSPEGTFLYSAAVQAPSADWVGIENAAVDSDGTMVLAVRAVSKPGIPFAGGIALFDRAGRQIRFFATSDYFPTQVAFGPDHSIWTIGWLGPKPDGDYLTLRNYAPDGQELGAFLQRSTFPTHEYAGVEQPLVMPILGAWEIRVVNDAVEVIFGREKLWVETDLHGREEHRWPIGPNNGQPGPYRRPSAITSDGRAWRREGNRLQLFDRAAGVWNTVAFGIPDGALLGAEGGSLVFLGMDRRSVRWIPAPATPVPRARQD